MNNIDFNRIAGWASIISLIISALTLIVTAQVKHEVNKALRVESEIAFWKQKKPIVIDNLMKIISCMEEYPKKAFGLTHISNWEQTKGIIQMSWSILFKYDSKFLKTYKICLWEWHFKKIDRILNMKENQGMDKGLKYCNRLLALVERES